MNVAFCCKGCKSAVMENDEQVDCSLGMLDKYSERGFVIDIAETDEGKFKVIEKKLGCKMYAGLEEKLEGEELYEKLRQKNQLEVGVVLFVDPDYSHDITILRKTIDNAVAYYEASTYKPTHFYFIDVSSKHIPLHNLLNKRTLPFTYTVCTSFNHDKDQAISDCKGWFQTNHLYVLGSGFDAEFLGELNEIMWDGSEEYALAYDGLGGYLTKSLLFYQWNGNDPETFEFEDESLLSETYVKYTDKVEFFARQNGQEQFIYDKNTRG